MDSTSALRKWWAVNRSWKNISAITMRRTHDRASPLRAIAGEMKSPAAELAARISASASCSGGLWSTEGLPHETYVIELPTSRRLAVVRDLGPMRTVHLMEGDPPIL